MTTFLNVLALHFIFRVIKVYIMCIIINLASLALNPSSVSV